MVEKRSWLSAPKISRQRRIFAAVSIAVSLLYRSFAVILQLTLPAV